MLLVVALLVLGVAGLVLGIYTAVDASKYPEWAFERAGTSKTLWIVVPVVLAIFLGVGALVMAIVWLASKKLQVATITLTYPSEWGPPPPPPGSPRRPRR